MTFKCFWWETKHYHLKLVLIYEGKLFIQLFVYTFYIILKFLNIKEEMNLGTFNST